MSFSFASTARFWMVFLGTGMIFGAFFAWELGWIPLLPTLPRPAPTRAEMIFTILLVLLLALTAGLFTWQQRYGSCPRGTRRASGIGGAVGAFALLCPVCLALPVTLLGVGASLAIFTPFLPLLRVIALLILSVTIYILWPRKH